MCLSNININLKLCWETSVIFASLSKSNYLPLLGEKTWNSDVWYFLNIHRWNLNTEGTDELRFVRDLWEMHKHVPKGLVVPSLQLYITSVSCCQCEITHFQQWHWFHHYSGSVLFTLKSESVYCLCKTCPHIKGKQDLNFSFTFMSYMQETITGLLFLSL